MSHSGVRKASFIFFFNELELVDMLTVNPLQQIGSLGPNLLFKEHGFSSLANPCQLNPLPCLVAYSHDSFCLSHPRGGSASAEWLRWTGMDAWRRAVGPEPPAYVSKTPAATPSPPG